jgi:pyridoxal phosphate enzyme (YggS family)
MAVDDIKRAASIADGLEKVRARIADACRTAGRSVDTVRLIAVTKGHDATAVRYAYQAGQRAFGENYIQQLSTKASELADLDPIEWRFIGHLQRNKVRDVARIGCAIDTVDSQRLAEALDKKAGEMQRVLDVLIQVNVAEEQQKAGCRVADLESLVALVQSLQWLRLKGLMTIPPLEEEPEACRGWFRELRLLAERFSLNELSMGMSDDLEVAIEEGATMVRVGTAIFGPRY